jgi:hypothetical protein
MKSLNLGFLLFLVLFFNNSCAQEFDWEKINEGLYLSKVGESNEKILSQDDLLNIEIYMFHPNDEIDLSNPINGKPTKFKIEYSKFFEMFQNEKKIKLKGNSEYFIKKINAKNIPKYSIGVNKISESEAKKIFQYIDKEYGIDFTEYASGKNDKNENVIFDITIQPKNIIDTEKVKNAFKKNILDIKVLKPNTLVYIFKIKT